MPPKSEYKKLDPKEHILIRPDTYIGSVKSITELLHIPSKNKENEIEMKEEYIKFVPGLLKIFDEILVNAIDHSVKDPTLKNINITINENYIEIYNDGSGIKLLFQKEYNCWDPELIFGHLLTSSNFDDSEERFVGGRNGYGAKLTNIYSTKFELETVDSQEKKKYSQTWEENMSKCSKPEIKEFKGKSFTKIRFYPDFKRFEGLDNKINDPHIKLFTRRVYDCAACTRKNVNVKLNGENLQLRDFQKYIDLFIGTKNEVKRVYQKEVNKKGMEWEIIASCNKNPDDPFKQISYVNGICTYKGGRHVEYITNQIVKKLTEKIKSKSKNKELNVRPGYIKDRINIFIRSTIVNPNFDSQSKEFLTTNVKDFGFKFEVSDKFIEDIAKLGIEQEIIEFTKFKETREAAKKTDGKKKNKLYGIPKLDDANKAGTVESWKCTIILTEGDSAAAFARAGLDIIGRDYYGVFPLKGKVLNVREATRKQIETNTEIINIKQIIGLQEQKIYKSVNELRYGKVMILTDADRDGSHIKGLIMNLFQYWWPSLFEIPGFLCSLATPIVKVRKGQEVKEFFTMTEYNKFIETTIGNWKTKYYKGLATSNIKEAKESFKNLERKLINYTSGITKEEKENSNKNIELAFKKTNADLRKIWVKNYNEEIILEQTEKTPLISDFINKDLIHFSIYDVKRSVPNLIDGLKPSQRKIIYGCFKKNLTKESIKVAQLSGYISENCAYHHGEASLNTCIITLAQNFIGSNNINLLYPDGMFGSRTENGDDAGSPRYIYTKLENITTKIFNLLDFPLLENLEEEGEIIEPKFYVPILPLILVNGSIGIGTGYSTNIPSFNPEDIIRNLISLMNNETKLEELKPWYRDFKGSIEKIKNCSSYNSKGIYKRLGDKKIEITEIPVGISITKFKENISSYITITGVKKEKTEKIKNQIVESFEEKHFQGNIRFIIDFKSKEILDELLEKDENSENSFEKDFKLTKKINISNMYLFDSNGIIKKYERTSDIIKEFYSVRLEFYEKRFSYIKAKLEKELRKISAKVRFITEIIADKITVFKKTREYINTKLEENGYPKFSEGGTENYNYLIKMSIDTFTKEKITELEKTKKEAEKSLEELLTKTPIKLWKEDLVDFLSELEKFNKIQIN